jgi:hypothetical protein
MAGPVGRRFTIILDPSDPHWIRLGNGKYAVDLADRWEARTPFSDYRAPRPYIDIKIPELQGSTGGKITIRWYSNDWHYIALQKSADGTNFTTVWERNAHYTFDEAYTLDLDPNCQYYRIHFQDGNYDYEVTGVYKNVDAEIYGPATPTVKVTRIELIDKDKNSSVVDVLAEDPVSKYAIKVSYSSDGNGKCTLTITCGLPLQQVEGVKVYSSPAVITYGSGYWTVDFSSFASGTIKDFINKISGGSTNIINGLQICADISNVTA